MFLEEQFFIITYIKVRFQIRYLLVIKFQKENYLQEALEKIFKKNVNIYVKAPKGSKSFFRFSKVKFKTNAYKF